MKSHRVLNTLVVVSLALSMMGMAGLAAPPMAQGSSPFVGQWQAVDADGGDMRLTIGGPPQGPFNITWTEAYFGLCGGEPGIGRGDGWISQDDPNVLQGHIRFDCFTTGETLETDVSWSYDPSTDTLTAHGGEGETDTVWHRPAHPPPPPSWIVIARPADDTVDGGTFPEGTVVSLLLMDDEHTVRWYGTATAAYPEWDPENAWVTFELDTDLMAGDHLWMYDGVNAKEVVVTPLEITGVDLTSLTLYGRAEPGSQVFVYLPPDTTEVTADQEGQWQVPFDVSQLGQEAMAYQVDPDGDQTLAGWGIPNPMPRIVASIEGDWFWTADFLPNALLSISIFELQGGSQIWEGTKSADESGFVVVEPGDHGLNLEPGNYLVVSDGSAEKGLLLETITIDVFNLEEGRMEGSAPALRYVYVVAADSPEAADQTAIETTADEDGRWIADFPEPFTDDWRAWSFAQIFDEDGDANEAGTPPLPHFSVFVEQEYIEGWEWPDGATVRASVSGKAECTAEGVSGPPEWDAQALFVSMSFPNDCDAAAGDVVTLSDGTTTLTHTVQNLGITAVDQTADTVTGTADSGAQVHVWPHGFDEVLVTADDFGTWTAAFSTDLVGGMCGRSEVRDEAGNATAVDWCVPNQRLGVFLDSPRVEGMGWPADVQVIFTASGKEACTSSAVPYFRPGDTETFFSIDLPEGCVIVPGDEVSMSGGDLTITHIVQELAVTAMDAEADTVTGTASVGVAVTVWIHGVGGSEQHVTANDGTWLADFGSAGFDVVQGTCGRAEILDGSNATWWDWCMPLVDSGNLYAVPDENRIWANGWIEGGEIALTIFDTNGEPFYWETRVVPPPSENPWTEVLFQSGFVLEPGQRIVIDQGSYVRELIVSSLRVTGFDLGAHTVSGTGDPGAEFFVQIGDVDAWGTIGADGTWAVQNENLTGGVWGGAIQFDEDWDSTRDIFMAPNPSLYAVPDENRIWANGWIEGVEISLTIINSGGETVYTESRVVPPPSENPWTEVLFQSGFVLEPGQRIVIDQGGYVRELIVSSLRVAGFDLGAHTISGTGDPGAEFFVRIGDVDAWGTIGADGTWSVQNENLAGGVWGEAIQPDADGDETRDGFQAPSS